MDLVVDKIREAMEQTQQPARFDLEIPCYFHQDDMLTGHASMGLLIGPASWRLQGCPDALFWMKTRRERDPACTLLLRQIARSVDALRSWNPRSLQRLVGISFDAACANVHAVQHGRAEGKCPDCPSCWTGLEAGCAVVCALPSRNRGRLSELARELHAALVQHPDQHPGAPIRMAISQFA